MAYCSNCGSNLESGDVFCPNCGTKRESDSGVPSQKALGNDPGPAKPMDGGYATSQQPSYMGGNLNPTRDKQMNQPYNPNQQYTGGTQPYSGNQFSQQPQYGSHAPYNQGQMQYQPYGKNRQGMDFIPWYIYILSFFIFPIGLYYYFANRREKPNSTKNLMYVVIAGFFFIYII